jgi:hypothetical protein
MSKESVDKQANAKDQGVVKASAKTQVSVGNATGVIVSTQNKSGNYDYEVRLKWDNRYANIPVDEQTAKTLANKHGTYGTTNNVYLTHDSVVQIGRELGIDVDFKAVYIDKNSHKKGAVNNEGDKSYTVNALAPATVTEWSTNSSAGRKEGKVITGANASKKVKANDTGKGGSGNGNGAASTGDGEGANSKVGGSGLGDGTGDGYGTGDGSGDKIETRSNNDTAQTIRVIDSGKSLDDKTAAADYASSITNGAINHIFHNSHYQEDPVPAWSFSVDFVPLCMTDKRFLKLYTLEDSKTLTKSVLTVTANEKTINTQSINYLGLQHPFFTKLAQSHGDLKITFAEDEYFSISTILKNVLKYASYLPNFPTNKVYEVKQGNWFDEIIIAHNASDSISPKYRLNSTDLKITDENTASLVHDYKFVFDILLKIYRPGNAHIFADEAAPPGFVYHFHKCWLKNVGGIELNYDDDKPIDRPVIFSYQYMSGVPYYEWVSRNNVLSESQELDKAYDEAAQQATDAASDVVQEAKEYSKNSPSSFTDNGEPISTSLNNLLDDAKNSKLNYLFK